jgi:small subunit ribosomal protein S1
MPLKEAALIPVASISEACDIDEEREFEIVSAENEDGQLTVSIRRIEYQGAWDTVLEVTAPLTPEIEFKESSST